MSARAILAHATTQKSTTRAQDKDNAENSNAQFWRKHSVWVAANRSR
jgi:hypothetical protein